jgi:predicted alpha/beta hydrolase
LRKPAFVISAPDDPWAAEAGVRRALCAYRNLILVRKVIDPASVETKCVGHWGYFRRRNALALWSPISRFINGELTATSSSIHFEQANHGYHAAGT